MKSNPPAPTPNPSPTEGEGLKHSASLPFPLYGGGGRGAGVPRSRVYATHAAMRDEILAAIKPLLFDARSDGYAVRRQLESEFAAHMQLKHAIAAHSGSLALFLALKAVGIKTGDEVITVANSDISTTGAISQCGATPVLCDVLESDYTIDVDKVEPLITSRTRAILPVDLHGHPANVKALRSIADRHNLKIVEDAALAAGARDYGLPLGAFADVAMYSFAPFKPLGCAGNGAMLVTDDDEIARQLRLLVGYGQAPAEPPSTHPHPLYGGGGKGAGVPDGYQDYVAEGFNVPLDPLQAALLLVKLPHLPAWTQRRQQIVAKLESALSDTSATTPSFRPDSEPTFRSYAITVDQQRDLHQTLRQAGIEAVIHYAPPITHYSVYASAFQDADLPVTERLARRVVNLPVTPELTDADVQYMIDVTLEALRPL